MKKFLAVLAGGILSLCGYAQQINDPNAELRTARDFHGISVSSAFTVYLSQGNEEAVAVSASEDRYRDRIKVEVKGGILYIGFDADGKMNWGSGNKKLKAYVSCKTIDLLKISGACDVFISGSLRADELTIDQSGASDLKGNLDVKKLTVDLNGASDIQVSGTATQLSVDASGASDFKGYGLVTETCNAKASGASDIKVTVNKELSGQASGASDVRYRGNGVIRDIRSSGSSTISKG